MQVERRRWKGLRCFKIWHVLKTRAIQFGLSVVSERRLVRRLDSPLSAMDTPGRI